MKQRRAFNIVPCAICVSVPTHPCTILSSTLTIGLIRVPVVVIKWGSVTPLKCAFSNDIRQTKPYL